MNNFNLVPPNFEAWFLASFGVSIEVAGARGDQSLELLRKCYADSARAHVQAAASLLEPKTSDLLLMAGEMSSGELRTARAVLAGLAARIRRLVPVL